MSEKKIRTTGITMQFSLYESIISIVEEKKQELSQYAVQHKLKLPRKKDLYNFAIANFRDVSASEFFDFRNRYHQCGEFSFATVAIIGAKNRQLMESHMDMLVKVARQHGYAMPSYRYLFNFIFSQISQITCQQYFNA